MRACATTTSAKFRPVWIAGIRIPERFGIPFRLTLPHVGFHRKIGSFAGHHVSPDGRVLSKDDWERQSAGWLPSDHDHEFVSSLMGRVIEPGKFANWIAPPVRGINNLPIRIRVRPFQLEFNCERICFVRLRALANGVCARTEAIRVIVERPIMVPSIPKPRARQRRPRSWKHAASMSESFTFCWKCCRQAGLIRVYEFLPVRGNPTHSRGTRKCFVTLHSFAAPPDEPVFRRLHTGACLRVRHNHRQRSRRSSISRDNSIRSIFTFTPRRRDSSRFGGIIASGWHTAGLAMRLYVDHFLSHVASLASPGVDELRWPNPVRPGDSLKVRVTFWKRGLPVRSRIEELFAPRSKRSIRKDELVLSMVGISILGRRARV